MAVSGIFKRQRVGRQSERYPNRYLRDSETEKSQKDQNLLKVFITFLGLHLDKGNTQIKYHKVLESTRARLQKIHHPNDCYKIQILLFPKGNKK